MSLTKIQREIVSKRHPCGGWTHALRIGGADTARVYVGWWPTARMCRDALRRVATGSGRVAALGGAEGAK